MSEELGRSPSVEIEANSALESTNKPEYSEEHNDSGQDLVPQQQASKSSAEEVVYEIKDEAEYNQTRAVFIGNLTTPFDNADFQRMLNDEAAKSGATIERAWLNNKRSHCIVIVSTVDGAVEIRKNLNGKLFPEVLERETEAEVGTPESHDSSHLRLYVDFIPVKATQLWIDQENHSPKDAVWRVSYATKIGRTSEKPFLIATHQMVNYPNQGLGYRSTGTSYRSGHRGYDRGDRGGYDRGSYDRGGYDRGGYDRGGYDRGGYRRGGHRGRGDRDPRDNRDREFRDQRDSVYHRRERDRYYGRRTGYRDSREYRPDDRVPRENRPASRSPVRYSRSRSPRRSPRGSPRGSPRWSNE
ncbi:unnamed protein product [Kuraishia capsulata CBS 1993]|uniref:Uncharacterized protein n=1 Tax=Kuraishia capsulata CBS 1993 TaxID=1382522 RepID=W6MG27_9ASCO|nr:uncharacterized protein KUCA_T00000350001 [Kuraishia capsulata CBS 1993]CDK24388.1 unnamed protein product [Kuraishia capsulata CBS 1993]